MELPPHSPEAEQAVLVACMLRADRDDVVGDVRARLKPEAFFGSANQHIFRSILSLNERGIPIDSARVLIDLREQGRDREVGGGEYLVKLCQVTPAIGNPIPHAEVIENYYRQREAIRVMQLGLTELRTPRSEVADYLESIAAEISALAQSGSQQQLQHISEIMPAVVAEVTYANENKCAITGIPSGLIDIDRMTTGSHDGDFTVVGGRTSMGKSAYILSVTRNEANAGYVSPIFSTEMPKVQLAMRLLSQEARVNLQQLRTGTYRPEAWGPITAAMAKLATLPIFLDDSSGLSPAIIRHRTKILLREIREGKYCDRNGTPARMGTVKIDYLQQLVSGSRRQNREEEIGDITTGLKGIAKDLSVHIMAASQVNRESEKRSKDHRPAISDLRGSGAIEQDADNIILLYRDEYYNRESEDKGIAEANIAKQRNGPTGVVKLKYTDTYACFENLAQRWESAPDDYGYEPDDYGIPGGL